MRLVRYTYPSFRSVTPAFGAFPRSPWAGLENEIGRLLETTVGSAAAPAAGRFPVDLFEDAANTYVRAELPGLAREDISVEMTDGYLTISATRKTPVATAVPAEGEAKPLETFSFSRAVSIAEEVQTDKVAAVYEHGVLTVTLPKRQAVQPKKITVAVK
jgi:HSP20 family protein